MQKWTRLTNSQRLTRDRMVAVLLQNDPNLSRQDAISEANRLTRGCARPPKYRSKRREHRSAADR